MQVYLDQPIIRGNLLNDSVALGLHWRDFRENVDLALSTHALQKAQVCDQSVIKGTSLEERCVFPAASLPLQGSLESPCFSVSTNALQTRTESVFVCISVFTGGVFLKLHTTLYPRMHSIGYKFGFSDQ